MRTGRIEGHLFLSDGKDFEKYFKSEELKQQPLDLSYFFPWRTRSFFSSHSASSSLV